MRAAVRTAVLPMMLLATLAAALAGCGTDGSETAALALQPVPAGVARVTIRRASTLMYAGVPATITLNGQKVADIASGGQTIVDVPAGPSVLKASAWSYPGEYTLQLNTVAGQTYDLDVAPREASIGPAVLFGAIGGLIDSSTNENAGLFELKLAGGREGSVRVMGKRASKVRQAASLASI